MQPETEPLVQSLRERVAVAQRELEDAVKRFEGNSDKYLNERIRLARNWLNDVENFFLVLLNNGRMPPRTAEEERRIIAQANSHLNEITLPLVAQIVAWSNSFGPDFKAVGY